MNDANRKLLLLTLAAKGVTGALADETVDLVEAVADSLLALPDLIEAKIEQAHSQTLLNLTSVGLALSNFEGYEIEGQNVMAGVRRLLADALQPTDATAPPASEPAPSVGAEGTDE